MLRALFADDSPGFLRGAARFFTRLGWKVVAVEDGSKARSALEESVFDVVVLDRQMPELNGDRVLAWMMRRPEHQYTCAVMCTAYGDVKSATEALKLGAWQYIQKPIKDLALLHAILLPGVALKRCNRMRGQLLQAESLPEFFRKLNEMCEELGGGGLHLMFTAPGGRVLGATGSPRRDTGSGSHAFVDKVIKYSTPVFAENEVETRALQPIREDSGTLLAVPVRGEKGTVIGVLDMESPEEGAFGAWWQEVLSYIADLIAVFKAGEARAALVSGMLYRELSHRIATHAQIVSMQTREILDDAGSVTPESRRRLEIIRRNADTIDSIVRELWEAATEPKLDIWVVNLRSVLEEAVEDVRAKKRLEPGQPLMEFSGLDAVPLVEINADRQWLRYCFDCVLENAWEAIDQAWKMDANRGESTAGQIQIATELDANTVNISIYDNGVGFDGRDRELLFTPLYSTKTRQAQGDEKPDTGKARLWQIFSILGAMVSDDPETVRKIERLRNFKIEIEDGESLFLRISHAELSEAVKLSARLPGHRANRGIGLYTVRRVLVEHGGEIRAQSPGVFQGATFTISLPTIKD